MVLMVLIPRAASLRRPADMGPKQGKTNKQTNIYTADNSKKAGWEDLEQHSQ